MCEENAELFRNRYRIYYEIYAPIWRQCSKIPIKLYLLNAALQYDTVIFDCLKALNLPLYLLLADYAKRDILIYIS